MGAAVAKQLTDQCLPIGDIVYQGQSARCRFGNFKKQISRIAEGLALGREYEETLARKKAGRAADEKAKPLAHYQAEELEEMKRNFFGDDRSYHGARSSFVRKTASNSHPCQDSLTPSTQKPEPAEFVSSIADGSAQHQHAYSAWVRRLSRQMAE